MRMNRIITGFVAFALAGSVSLVSASSAQAAPAVGHDAATTTSAQAPVARKLPKRHITEKIVQKGTRKLVFKGKVTGKPAYSHKVVKLQRRVGKHGHWKTVAKMKSNKKGHVHHRVGAPRNGRFYFRAATPKTGKFRASHSAGNFYTYTL